ncbi:MAG: tetratricopeptide repeat protein [Microscillaceae bacterium]|nr:tetratricopeptide repeat protein [Microscillaceae bacterium]MDW8461184.1 tetratricopeptide repeat protein [Cytophagales bacterium]
MAKSTKTIKAQQPNSTTTSETIYDSPDLLSLKLQETSRKYRKVFFIVLGVIAVVALAYIGFNYYLEQQEKEAQEEMFAAQYYIEADSLKKALNGDGNRLGFKQIIQDYPWTKAANLARFYVGVIYLKEGKFEEAIENLRKFSSNDLLLQGRAYALLGDAHMELKKYNEAIKYYKKAADYKPNKYHTPIYLMKLALSYEQAKKYEAAILTYEKLIKNYPNSSDYVNAKKYKAYLEQITGK